MKGKDITGNAETLFIPLLSKARAARWGAFPPDRKAAEIVSSVDYDFHKMRGQSRFLDIYMGIRASILDGCAETFLRAHPDAAVLHLGCGLDARVERIQVPSALWVDVDLPEVIAVRRNFYRETPHRRMVAASVTDPGWLESLDCGGVQTALVVAEGLTMYLTGEENRALFQRIQQKFQHAEVVFDAYSRSAVAWSRYKNPVNRMGAVIRWGLDDPGLMEGPGIRHLETRYFTESQWSERLSGWTRTLFRLFYGNSWADSLYRIYRYEIRQG